MRNLAAIFMITVVIISCKKDKTYKLNDDLCEACAQNPVHRVGNDTLRIPNVITSNGDGFNDSFYC